MQMRYLQTLAEVASERNFTISFPLPIELLLPFLDSATDSASSAAKSNGKVDDVPLVIKDRVLIEPNIGAGTTRQR